MSSSSSLQRSADLAEPTSKATSLLDLPDELLVDIFQAVYDLERSNEREGLAVSLERVVVNKRIWSAASHIWFEHLHITEPRNEYPTFAFDEFFGGMFMSKQLQRLVKSVLIDAEDMSCPLLTAALLQSFASLETLSIWGADYVPAALVDVLPTLKALKVLEIFDCPDTDFGTLDLSTSAIRIMSFGTSASWYLHFSEGLALEQLTLHADADLYDVPWSTLEVLRLTGNICGQASQHPEILDSLEWAADDVDELPLREFELSILDFDRHPLVADQDGFRREQYNVLYTVLQLASPQVLTLTRVQYCPLAPPRGVGPFLGVVELELEADSKLVELATFAGFVAFLALFPSLSRFTLVDCFESNIGVSLIVDCASMSHDTFASWYLCFAGLLNVLEASAVLEFEYRPKNVGVFLRCTRRSREDKLERDMWRKLRTSEWIVTL